MSCLPSCCVVPHAPAALPSQSLQREIADFSKDADKRIKAAKDKLKSARVALEAARKALRAAEQELQRAIAEGEAAAAEQVKLLEASGAAEAGVKGEGKQ